MYKPNPICYSDLFAIPATIADTCLQDASGDSLKAILWIYRHPAESISLDALSKALSLSADAVLSALDFWVSKGILLFTDDAGNVKFIPKAQRAEHTPITPKIEKNTTSAVSSTSPKEKTMPTIVFSKPTMEQIAARMQEDSEVESLFTEAQCILGRTFGLDMQGTLLTFLDTYGLPKEVILTLLQHLSETGKNSTANIAKVGKIWAEKEIHTLTQANEYIQSDAEAEKLFTKFKMETGITTPKPTAKQSEFLRSWIALGVSFEMIMSAYEETAERTGKISFAYMDKVLRNWKNEGFNSKQDIVAAKQQARAQKNAVKESKSSSFDLDEAVRKATFSAKKQS